MSDKMWEVTLKHARECVLGNKLYILRELNSVVVLNPICQVVRANIEGHVYSGQEAPNQVFTYRPMIV